MSGSEEGRRARRTGGGVAAQQVNELVEAADERRLARLVARYGRLDLLCVDEVGYVQLDARGAELLFQVLTEREEESSVGLDSNLPFSEWGQIITRRPTRRRRHRPHHLRRTQPEVRAKRRDRSDAARRVVGLTLGMPPTELREAIDHGDVPRARELLRSEPALATALIAAPDIEPMSPLAAAVNERLTIIDQLLAAGTPIDAEVDGQPAIHWAREQGRSSAVEHLASRGATRPR